MLEFKFNVDVAATLLDTGLEIVTYVGNADQVKHLDYEELCDDVISYNTVAYGRMKESDKENVRAVITALYDAARYLEDKLDTVEDYNDSNN